MIEVVVIPRGPYRLRLRLATVAHATLRAMCGQLLMLGWSRGLIPGADPELGRRARLRTKRAA